MGHTRGDDLAPAGVAGHEMRLDQAGGDPHLRLDEAPVELHRNPAPLGPPEIDMGCIIAGEVVLDPHRAEYPRVADQRLELAPSFDDAARSRPDRDRGG
jgi:hypothetical protein